MEDIIAMVLWLIGAALIIPLLTAIAFALKALLDRFLP